MTGASSLSRTPGARIIDRHRIFPWLIALIALVALLAASRGVAAAPSACEARALHGHEALHAGSLANWEPVNDRAVLIWTRHTSRAHLVKLAMPLQGLTSAEIITLVDGDDDQAISPCGHDGLRLGDAAEVTRSAVRIVSIELLSAKRTAELDRGAQLPALASEIVAARCATARAKSGG